MMQVCLCGTQPGYRHEPDCPYPLFRGSDTQQDMWYAAREAARERIAAYREAAQHVADEDAAHDDDVGGNGCDLS